VRNCCAPRRSRPAVCWPCRSAAYRQSPAPLSSRRALIPGAARAANRRSTTSCNDILASLRERGEASVDVDGNRCRSHRQRPCRCSQRAAARGTRQARGTADLPVLLDPELQPCFRAWMRWRAKPARSATGALWEAWQEQQGNVEHRASDEVHLIDRLPLLAASGGRHGSAAARRPAPRLSLRNPQRRLAPGGRKPSPRRHTHVLLGTRALPLRGDRSKTSVAASELRREERHTGPLHGDGGLVNGLPSTPRATAAPGRYAVPGHAGHGRLIEVVG
jgi:hypothetical protein